MPNNRDESGEQSLNWEDVRSLPATKPTSLAYVVGAGSDPGKRKKRNEDSILAVSSTTNTPPVPLPSGLFVLADGMGAYADGQDASCGAIQAMVDHIWPKIVGSNTMQSEACSALLTEAVQLANEVVNQQNIHLHNMLDNRANDDDVGVLTTVTAAMIVGSTAYIANVGNSRTYLYRAGEGLKQVTRDHTIVARLVADGILTPEDVYTHLHRHQIYRALFDQPLVEVDIFTVSLYLGDTLLLCSDGLWNMVRDSKIEEVLGQAPPDPFHATKVLIQAALDGGGPDNISVIVVSMEEAQDQMLGPDVQLFAKPDSVHLPQA